MGQGWRRNILRLVVEQLRKVAWHFPLLSRNILRPVTGRLALKPAHKVVPRRYASGCASTPARYFATSILARLTSALAAGIGLMVCRIRPGADRFSSNCFKLNRVVPGIVRQCPVYTSSGAKRGSWIKEFLTGFFAVYLAGNLGENSILAFETPVFFTHHPNS